MEIGTIKAAVILGLGVVGGYISTLFGGWDAAMTTLVIVMVVDFITGLIVAGVFKSSEKTDTGGLSSKAGWEGLCKKGVGLLIVLVAAQLDVTLNTTFVKDAVVIGFITNESISIVENAGLMGIPLPAVIIKAIDMLKQKNDNEDSEE